MGGIGALNPIRYRGYYWDEEIALYYLNARYYDPEVGRFISQDSIKYIAPETLNGINLFAYCLNNPVMGKDPQGTWSWGKFWSTLAVVAVAVVAVAAITAITVATGGSAAPVLIGATFGAVAGSAGNLFSQVSENGWSNVDWGQVVFNGATGMVTGALMGSPFNSIVTGVGVGAVSFAQSVGNDLYDSEGDWSKVNWGKAATVAIASGLISGAGKYLKNLGNNVGSNYDKVTQDSFATIRAFILFGKAFAKVASFATSLARAGIKSLINNSFVW